MADAADGGQQCQNAADVAAHPSAAALPFLGSESYGCPDERKVQDQPHEQAKLLDRHLADVKEVDDFPGDVGCQGQQRHAVRLCC